MLFAFRSAAAHLFGAGALALAMAAQPALAQDSGAAQGEGDDPVAAVVNGEEIRVSDVVASAEQLPPQYRAQLGMIFPALVERMVDMQLLAEAGRAQGLADDEEVRRLMEQAEVEAIRQVYLRRVIEQEITPEDLDQAYATYLQENPPKSEVRARHILQEDKAAAEETIKLLDAGGDFAELAKERSTGPSGPEGGDLGYFTADQMVPPFSEAAFAMEPGTYSKTPVETQFGWHVIYVEDRRETAPPSREEVADQLREQLARAAVDEHLAALRADAEVEIRELSPDQLPAGPGAPAGAGAAQ